nr:aldo/keto reductase [Ignavibacteria bacterium]
MNNNDITSPSTFLLGGELEINRLGYGAMQLTGHGVFGDMPDREKGKEILDFAVASGINFIDTADAYGPYTNETPIADALHPYPAELVIATKGGFERPSAGQWVINGNPEHIKEAIEG